MLLLLVCLVAYALAQPTDCNTQLYNYYVGMGLPNITTPMQTALTLTSGTFLGTTFVTATMGFQAAARAYQQLLNPALVASTWSVFDSIDIPWCTSRIVLQCCEQTVQGMAKTSNCTTLIDFDQGAPNLNGGRFFIYANQSIPACNGTPVVTYYNVTLQPTQEPDIYTYDAVGIRDHIQLTFAEAQLVYRTSYCNYTDGSPASMANQNQFVCIAERIGCAGNRTTAAPQAPAVPLPVYACTGNITPNGSVQTVWWVESMQQANTIDISFGLTFTNSLNSALYYEVIYGASGQFYTLVAGTRRQFVSGYSDFNNQYALLNYNGLWWQYAPQYPFSNNPVIAQVPCICNFSVDCTPDGQVDLTSIVSNVIRFNNAPPIPDAGPDIQINWFTPFFYLNASGTYDPDNGPGPLTVFWRVNSTPYDPAPPPFTLDNPDAFLIAINSSALEPGSYIFLLYASDGQARPFVFFNATILPNVVTAMVENNKIVLFTLYSGGEPNHTCFIYPPSPTISINGTGSHGTNPSIPLYYQWVQLSGFQLTYFCDPNGFIPTSGFFNTTSPIAEFVPRTFGRYQFQLTVTDNVSTSTALLQVQVNPDFQQPPSTFTPIINFTDPPILNLTPPTRVELNFSNATLPPLAPHSPVAPPPPSNITPPPIIPIYPPPTPSEFVALLFIASAMFLLLFFIMTAWWLFRHKIMLRYYDSVLVGPVGKEKVD